MPTATATAPQRALTIVERVETSPAVLMLDARSQALIELLPDAAAATRFRRVVIQALAKNPDLLDCTPESVVLSVFEAATQGLEPTGAAGGAHLVPFNKKVSKNPERWEKQAQLIPDYRGVVRLVTKPHDEKGRLVPSDVSAIEARVVKEGDDFSWTEGIDASIHHVPTLTAGRSTKATTHVYAVGRLANGASVFTVMDRAEVEAIRKRGREQSFSPWSTDWDEMAKKTVVKRLSKLLPVRPEVRSILVREDELTEAPGPAAAATRAGAQSKTLRLAQRLAPAPAVAPSQAEPETIEGTATDVVDEPPADPAWVAGDQVDVAALIRDSAAISGMTGAATPPQQERLRTLLAPLNRTGVIAGALAVLFGDGEELTAARAQALLNTADSMGTDEFLAALREMARRAAR